MRKLVITMADGKQLHVTRNAFDVFRDSWSTTVVHQGGKVIRLTNKWIVMQEDDDDARKK